jgi:hypothetical protein
LASVKTRWDRLTRSPLGDAFALDLRSLAVFRIVLGVLVMLDIAARIPNFRAFYSESGVMPRDLVTATMAETRWSLFLINSSNIFQWFLLYLGIAAGVAMIVGYRTRVATIVAWAILISLQVRNPIVLSGADTLLRLVVFWAMFLPLGARFSFDARNAAPEERPTVMRYLSFGTVGLLLQIAIMYWCTAWLKDGPSWRGDGTALYYATGAHQITRPFGEWAHQFEEALKIGTHIGFGIEALAPFFLFIPWRKGMLRMIAIGAIISLHLGIVLIMDVALFPYVSAAVMLAFLPGWFWAVAPRFVTMARESRLLKGRSLPSLPMLRPRPIAAGSSGSLAGVDDVHMAASEPDGGAGRRGAAARATSALRELRPSALGNVCAVACLLVVLIWNASTVSALTVPDAIRPVGYGLGLYQKWNMFAPNPPKSTVWYTVRGYVEGGEAVDLVTPVVYDDFTTAYAFDWTRPDNIVSGYYKDKYWRKYLTAIAGDNYSRHRREFAGYVCRNWNSYYGGDARLKTVQLIVVKQPTLMGGQEGEEDRELIASFTCS